MAVEEPYLPPEIINSFVADGLVPPPYAHRTVVEYRAHLHPVPPWPSPVATDVEADLITPPHAAPRPIADEQPVPPPNHAQVDAALRALGKVLDMSGMGSLDPRYLCVLRVHRPFFLGGRARPAAAVRKPDEGHGVLAALGNAFNSWFGKPEQPCETQTALLSWHWAEDLIAVATGARLDRICAFSFQNGVWEIAGQRVPAFQGTRCLAFRPFAGRVLAIGCDDGVVLLRGTKTEHLRAPGHTHVVSLDWSSDGSKLATASAADGLVRLWDVGTGKSMVVDRGGLVCFSRGAGGRFLFVASAVGNFFRLWCTETWTTERWGYLSGPVAAVTWSPDGMTLFFSTHGESAIHVISIGGPRVDDDTKVIHTEHTELPEKGGPGGTPVLLEMDSSGERLAVAYETPQEELESGGGLNNEDFRTDPNRRHVVALYATQLQPTFRVSPVGYVSGPEESGPPVGIKFNSRGNANKLTVLSCMWRSGDVTCTQLLFNPYRQ